MIFKDKYTDGINRGSIGFPGYDTTEDEGGMFLAWGEYIWSRYVTDQCLVNSDGYIGSDGRKRSIPELRAYANDRQPIHKYQQRLDPQKDKTVKSADNEGLMNISWDPPKILSKFIEIVRGKTDEIVFDFKTTAIDVTARKEKDIRKAKKMILADPKMKQVLDVIGMKPSENIDMTGIGRPEDVDMLDKLGGERLAYEMAMDAAIRATIDISKWNDVMKVEMQDDLIELALCATATSLDPYTKRVKCERVDPVDLVCDASRKMDFSDLTWIGRRRTISIHQLRAESGLDEKDIYLIAKQYKSNNQSGGTNNYSGFTNLENRNKFYQANNRQVYDDFNVTILEFYFIGNKTEKYIIGEHHRTGAQIMDRVPMNAELSERDRIRRKKEFKYNAVNYVYKGHMIVGTKYLYDCGIEEAVVRSGDPGNKVAELPIKVFSTGKPSMVEKCIASIDDICLATYKIRDSIAKMIPAPGISIDISKVETEINIGGNKYNIAQLLGMASRSGVLIYQSLPDYMSSTQNGSGRNPIEPLRDRVVEILQVLNSQVAVYVDQIRQATGINEVADGSARADMLVGVVKGLDAATNSALRPMFRTYGIAAKYTCIYWMRKWQAALISGEIEIKYQPIGEDVFSILTLTPELRDHEFGVSIELMPTSDEKQMLLGFLVEKRQQGMIRVDDYFNLERMINNNQIAKARLYAAVAIDRQEQEMRQQEMAKIQAQAQANSEAAQNAEAAKVQSAQQIAMIEVEKEKALLETKKALIEFDISLKAQVAAMSQSAEIAMAQRQE